METQRVIEAPRIYVSTFTFFVAQPSQSCHIKRAPMLSLGASRACARLTKPLVLAAPSRRLSSFRAPSLPRKIRILEVAPRDGLQNIKNYVPTDLKVELIQRLAETGLTDIEATSFVSPKWVPQLADGAVVMDRVRPLAQDSSMRLPVLAPTMKGLQLAQEAGAKEVVVFASATEGFSKANQNCSVDEALTAAEQVARQALASGLAVRGVISCIFSDPVSGPTDPQQVLRVAKRFLAMGCHEVGLGDTLGVGTAWKTQTLLDRLLSDIPADKLAGHFHDTYGQAVANVIASYNMGIRSFDSSVAGLGGCPYANGAKGNVATEDIVYAFEESGIDTDIDIMKLANVGAWISTQLRLPNSSRAGAALVARSSQSQSTIAPSSSVRASPPDTAPQSAVEEIKEMEGFKGERDGATYKITLARPEKGNSLTPKTLSTLTKLYRELAQDPTCFRIVLAAEGKYFCTGMDFSTDTDRTSTQGNYFGLVKDLFKAIEDSPQTTIAVVDGPAYGGGVGLTFACDVRIATPRARWTLSEIKLGLQPAVISRFMAREWGFSFFREAMLSGREVHSGELKDIGAIHHVVPDHESLDKAVEAYLDRLQACAPRSASRCKDLVRLAWRDADGPEQDAQIEKLFLTMMAPGSEGEHGISQFQQKKRKINWAAFWSRQ